MIKYHKKGVVPMLNIAICDDNQIFLDDFAKTISSCIKEDHNILKFANANDLLNIIEDYSDESIDVVITDIEMPEMNGINMAKELKNLHPRIQFIFVTNYTEYIQDVFAVNPVYYILKPVDKNKLSEALEKAVAELSESDKKCFNVTGKNKILRIRFNEIKYIESFSRKIIVHETRRNTELLMKLDDFEKELPPYFLRIHKSYSVNMNMIRSINNNRIELFSGEVIPVAKAKYPEIKKNILAFLSSQL